MSQSSLQDDPAHSPRLLGTGSGPQQPFRSTYLLRARPSMSILTHRLHGTAWKWFLYSRRHLMPWKSEGMNEAVNDNKSNPESRACLEIVHI